MSIPAIEQEVVEIVQKGTVAAAGSNAKYSEQVLHFRRTPTITPVDKSNVEAAYQVAIGGTIALALNERYTQQFVSVRIVNDALDQPVEFAENDAGAVTGDSMALTTSAYLIKRTGIRGRSYMGSLKLYPLSESQTTNGTDDELNAGALTVFGNVASAILAGFTDSDGNNWVPVVLSRKLSTLTSNPTNVVASTVVSIAVRKTMGVMRHRRPVSVY